MSSLLTTREKRGGSGVKESPLHTKLSNGHSAWSQLDRLAHVTRETSETSKGHMTQSQSQSQESSKTWSRTGLMPGPRFFLQANPPTERALVDWAGSSFSKVVALQAWGHEFEPQHPHKTLGVVACVCGPGTGEVQRQEGLWGSQTVQPNQWLMDQWETLCQLCLRGGRHYSSGWHPRLSSGSTGIGTCTHTYTNI